VTDKYCHILSRIQSRAEGAQVRLRRARDIVGPDVIPKVPGWAENRARMDAAYPAPTSDDAEWADGIVFGTPTRFGNVCTELKAYIDSLGGLWLQGKFNGKATPIQSSSARALPTALPPCRGSPVRRLRLTIWRSPVFRARE
jgi:multimeric flavodoxin WrbA